MEGIEHEYDPESLLTGAEAEAGCTFENPRQWPDQATADRAYAGELTPEEVARLGPRNPKIFFTEAAA